MPTEKRWRAPSTESIGICMIVKTLATRGADKGNHILNGATISRRHDEFKQAQKPASCMPAPVAKQLRYNSQCVDIAASSAPGRASKGYQNDPLGRKLLVLTFQLRTVSRKHTFRQ